MAVKLEVLPQHHLATSTEFDVRRRSSLESCQRHNTQYIVASGEAV
jgi:hypothetical protein